MSRNGANGELQLPGVVNLYFSHPRLSAALDAAEELYFGSVGTSTDLVWNGSFDITDVLACVSALIADCERCDADGARALSAELLASYEAIYVPWLSELGLQSETDADGRTTWRWQPAMPAYVRAVYVPAFVNLTQGGVVSRSPDFCDLFGELLLTADSRVDTSLASATLMIECALAATGQLDAEVGRLMSLLDQLTRERERWRATLAAPFERAVDNAAPLPLHVSSVVRDQLQSTADARLRELDVLIGNVEDALHEQTAHFDDVVAATRRQRVALSAAERTLRRRAAGDDEWAHAMFETSRACPDGVPPSPRASMTLHGAWHAWLLADAASCSAQAALAVVAKGRGAAFFWCREGADASAHEPIAGAARNALRVLKSAVPEQPYAVSEEGGIALPQVSAVEEALVARIVKDAPLSAPERSCASERGGALFLLREAIQHWLSADVEPQLCEHMAVVQAHRRDCTDRRRRPPALALAIGAAHVAAIAVATLALTGLPNARATLAFARKLVEHHDVVLGFSVHEFYNAMWCDERRVTSADDLGAALDALRYPPLRCNDRCVARQALTIAASAPRDSARVWIAGRLNPLRFEIGGGDGWDLYRDSLRMQPLAVVDVRAECSAAFGAFWSEHGAAPSPLALAQHALRGSSPFGHTTVQLYRCVDAADQWRSPPVAMHASSVGSAAPLWFASGASLNAVVLCIDASVFTPETALSLKRAVDNATVESVAWRAMPGVIVAFGSRLANKCVIFGTHEDVSQHVVAVGSGAPLAVGVAHDLGEAGGVLLASADVAQRTTGECAANLVARIAQRQASALYTTPVVASSAPSGRELRERTQFAAVVARKWSPFTSTASVLDEWMCEVCGDIAFGALLFAPRVAI